jgi:hypothetical protein
MTSLPLLPPHSPMIMIMDRLDSSLCIVLIPASRSCSFCYDMSTHGLLFIIHPSILPPSTPRSFSIHPPKSSRLYDCTMLMFACYVSHPHPHGLLVLVFPPPPPHSLLVSPVSIPHVYVCLFPRTASSSPSSPSSFVSLHLHSTLRAAHPYSFVSSSLSRCRDAMDVLISSSPFLPHASIDSSHPIPSHVSCVLCRVVSPVRVSSLVHTSCMRVCAYRLVSFTLSDQ